MVQVSERNEKNKGFPFSVDALIQNVFSLLVSEKFREYSNYPYSGYYKFLDPAVNLHDADLIKDILIKDHFNFHINEQRFNQKSDPLMSLNPFGARDDAWRKGRNVLTPMLTLFKVGYLIF